MFDVISYLEKEYPYYLQERWDHSGNQIGNRLDKVSKILLCLDYTSNVNNIRKEFNPDIIISHHPFFFGDRREIILSNPLKREMAYEILNSNQCLYSFHTNYDNSIKGMNYQACKKLGLINCYTHPFCNTMHIGFFEKEKDIKEVSKLVKDKLNVPYILSSINNDSKIKKVGIILGGGASFYIDSSIEKCDLYISGDMSHHTRLEIQEAKLNYFDIPHEVEKIFMYALKEELLEKDPSLEIKIVDDQKMPIIL